MPLVQVNIMENGDIVLSLGILLIIFWALIFLYIIISE